MSMECMQIMENNNNGENMENRSNNSEFPKGMRVLAVDDNEVCLKLLSRLLTKCQYQVKSLRNKTEALGLLKQQVDNFDIVLTNVNNDEMDGFKLLEAGLELDIPVIMISACESEPIIMKGVRHGAVDYLIKPVRLEAVKTIWQHVYRKNLSTSPNPVENPGRDEIQGGFTRIDDEMRIVMAKRRVIKRKSSPEDDDDVISNDDNENCNGDQILSKKDRIKWTHDLHEKFLDVIQSLGGYEKAVPKKILELMNDPSLTREKVASHLQKFRNCLKKKLKLEEDIVPTSTVTTTTNNNNNISYNNYDHLFPSSSNGSLVATTLSNRPILGNTSRTMFPTPNYQFPINNNPWLPPLLQPQQQRVERVNQLLYPQQSMMHIDRNYMSTVSNTLAEPLYPQLPPVNLVDTTRQQAQAPEEIFDPSYSMMDPIYETSPLNNILDVTSDYPGLLEYSEDGKKDQYYRTS